MIKKVENILIKINVFNFLLMITLLKYAFSNFKFVWDLSKICIKVCWSKEKNKILFEILYELFDICVMSVIRVFKKCLNKEKNHFLVDTCLTFLTLVWLFRHVSYGCHTSVGHRRVSDTATRLLLEVSGPNFCSKLLIDSYQTWGGKINISLMSTKAKYIEGVWIKSRDGSVRKKPT